MATESSRLLSASGRNRLLVGTAMLGSLVAGYGRRAYAQCVPTAPFSGVYSCSGALTTTQLLVGTPLSVTTTPGFSIVTTTGDAFTLAGDTGLTFTDNNASTISGVQNGINAYLVGSSTGNIVISTSGPVTGGTNGINAYVSRQLPGGSITITTTGPVTGGTNGDGIHASSYHGSVTITASGAVSGR